MIKIIDNYVLKNESLPNYLNRNIVLGSVVIAATAYRYNTPISQIGIGLGVTFGAKMLLNRDIENDLIYLREKFPTQESKINWLIIKYLEFGTMFLTLQIKFYKLINKLSVPIVKLILPWATKRAFSYNEKENSQHFISTFLVYIKNKSLIEDLNNCLIDVLCQIKAECKNRKMKINDFASEDLQAFIQEAQDIDESEQKQQILKILSELNIPVSEKNKK